MCPELLIAVLPLHRFACLPLFLCHPFEMLIAVLIQAVIRDKPGCFDHPMLAHSNHSQLLHIQIDRHSDQIGITLAFHDLPGFDGLGLHEMNGRRLLAQDQCGACCLPSTFRSSALKIAVVAGGIVNPHPPRTRIDLEANKTLPEIQFIQIQREGTRVESRVIRSRGNAWLPLLFA